MDARKSSMDINSAEYCWELQRASKIAELKNQLIPKDFPFLVEKDTGMICEPALIYLYDSQVANNPNHSTNNTKNNTLEAIAFDLKDWWNYLELIERAWCNATTQDLIKYCRVMQGESSPTTGKPNAVTTVNRRKSSIQKMYQWAQLHLKESLPLDQKHKYLLTLDWANEKIARVKNNAASTKAPTILQQKDIQKILGHLGETTYALAVKIAVMTGLRISEIVNLNASDFSLGKEFLATPASMIRIGVKGKGKKFRKVNFPGPLFNEISLYVYGQRQQIVKDTKQTNLSNLLLHKYKGSVTPISTRSIQRHFHQACMKSEITRYSIIFKGDFHDTERKPTSRKVTEAAAVFHDLRHTFAVWTYYARKHAGDSEPWMYIQQQLGHSHLSTTQDIYLASTLDFEAIVSDSYLKALNEKSQGFAISKS